MTPTQRKQIRNGDRRIYEALNRAYGEYASSECTTEQTFYSQRGQRYNRGRKIN